METKSECSMPENRIEDDSNDSIEKLSLEKLNIEREWKRIDWEKKLLADEQSLFNQKLEILKASYLQLDEDKRTLEREKIQFEAEKDLLKHSQPSAGSKSASVSYFFKGVTSPLALKKRYKDLIKIFHPDNLCGDKETLQMINQEYEILLQDLERFMEA